MTFKKFLIILVAIWALFTAGYHFFGNANELSKDSNFRPVQAFFQFQSALISDIGEGLGIFARGLLPIAKDHEREALQESILEKERPSGSKPNN